MEGVRQPTANKRPLCLRFIFTITFFFNDKTHLLLFICLSSTASLIKTFFYNKTRLLLFIYLSTPSISSVYKVRVHFKVQINYLFISVYKVAFQGSNNLSNAWSSIIMVCYVDFVKKKGYQSMNIWKSFL